jgi:hypothetical protein
MFEIQPPERTIPQLFIFNCCTVAQQNTTSTFILQVEGFVTIGWRLAYPTHALSLCVKQTSPPLLLFMMVVMIFFFVFVLTEEPKYNNNNNNNNNNLRTITKTL